MKKEIKFLPILLLCSGIQVGNCQSRDTVALMKEFNKVISFAARPHLYYATMTKMDAVPVLNDKDTFRVAGVFYKNGANFYYDNGQAETILEDSLLIQIDNERKTIWISKVDVNSLENMNVSPLDSKDLRNLFRKNYTISKTTGNDIARMDFETKQQPQVSTNITTKIGLTYDPRSWMPVGMEMEMTMQEPASDEVLAALKTEGISNEGLVQTIGDNRYLVRKQKMTIRFSDIDTSEEKASRMPSWKDKVESEGLEFTGKGNYKDYEIIKTF